MNALLKKFDEELPSLFENGEPDLFSEHKDKLDDISLNEPREKY